MTMLDRDAMIKLAISAPADTEAPAGLREEILRAVQATPQRRPATWARLFDWVGPMRSQAPALVGLALLILALVVGLLIVLSQQRSAHQLAMYHGGPERTGVMPGPGPEGVPVALWEVARPGPLPFTTMPLVENGRVYVADARGTVAALDAATGQLIWERNVGSGIHGTPALVSDLIVVGTDAGEMIALDVLDGARAWATPLSAEPITGSPLVANGRLYAGGDDGILHVLEAAGGREAWRFTLSGAITRGPALSDGVLFQGATGGQFVALDIATQRQRGSVELGPGEVGTPIVGTGLVYVARGLLAPAGARDLVALDTASMTIRWTYAAPDGQQVYAAGLADGLLFVSSETGQLHALDATTGEVRWTSQSHGVLGTLASIVGHTLYVGSDDRTVRAFDSATGVEMWAVSVTGLPTQQAVVDGRLFLGTGLGRVIALGDGPAASSP